MIPGRKNAKKRVDSPVTGLSNWDPAFVFNKSAMGGGVLAEGYIGRGPQKDRVIW